VDEKIIDTRGQLCPKPLILTKKAYRSKNIEDQFTVLIDNETSKENVERFLKDNRIKFRTEKKNNCFHLYVTKQNKIIKTEPEDYCPTPEKKDIPGKHVICIKNDKMGFGEEELGKILIKGFINTIKEVEPLPDKIIFYNNGALLTLEESGLHDSLKELENSGVKILVCGTCADYYGIKNKIKIGIISNMYDITESLTKASHVIIP